MAIKKGLAGISLAIIFWVDSHDKNLWRTDRVPQESWDPLQFISSVRPSINHRSMALMVRTLSELEEDGNSHNCRGSLTLVRRGRNYGMNVRVASDSKANLLLVGWRKVVGASSG